MHDTGLRRREDDFKLHPEKEPGIYPGRDRRQRGPRIRRKVPGKEFLRRFRRPIIGLSLIGTAGPLAVAQAKADREARAAEESEAARAAAAAATPAAAAPTTETPADTEDAIAAKIGEERQTARRSSHVGGAMQRYNISEALANDIYDVAMQEGIDPKLAFGLVKAESSFNPRAISHVGARGLTQVMPRTARWLLPGTSTEDLYNRRTNLRLGFRYLNSLIDKYKGDVQTALTAYNRGPGTVDRIVRRGGDPDNGYAGKVMGGALKI